MNTPPTWRMALALALLLWPGSGRLELQAQPMASSGPGAPTATSATATIPSSPFVTVLTPTSYSVTNGATLIFPDTTTMWLNIATNSIWFQYTNTAYSAGNLTYYSAGGTIYVKDGDNILKTNIDFCQNTAAFATNWSWTWNIIGDAPDQDTFIFTCTNSGREGLLYFGSPTNTIWGGMSPGGFKMRNIGLFAPNQSNEIVEVVGANHIDIEDVYGAETNALPYIFSVPAALNSRELETTFGINNNNSLSIFRLLDFGDNGHVVQNCLFANCVYGVIEDVNTVNNNNLMSAGGVLAIVHSRVGSWENDSGESTDGGSCVIYDKNLRIAGGFVGVFGPGNSSYAGYALVINTAYTVSGALNGFGTEWNVVNNRHTDPYGTPLIANKAGAIVNMETFPESAAGRGYVVLSGPGAQGSPNGVSNTVTVLTDNSELDDGAGNSIMPGSVAIGGALNYIPSMGTIMVSTNAGGTFPPNIVGLNNATPYTFCTNNLSLGLVIYTNNLAVTTNVLAFAAVQGPYLLAGWSLCPSNELAGGWKFNFAPVNGGTLNNVSGEWGDKTDNFLSSTLNVSFPTVPLIQNGDLLVSNLALSYSAIIISTNAGAGVAPNIVGLNNSTPYVFCYTNAILGFSLYTNALPVGTNAVAYVPQDDPQPWVLAPSNEIADLFQVSTFAFVPPNLSLGGNWTDIDNKYPGSSLTASAYNINQPVFQTTTNYAPSTWTPVPGNWILRASNNVLVIITTTGTNEAISFK